MQINTVFSKLQINNAIARINNDILTHFELLFDGVKINSAADILNKILENEPEFEIVLFTAYDTKIRVTRKLESISPTYCIDGLNNQAIKAIQTLDKLIALNI